MRSLSFLWLALLLGAALLPACGMRARGPDLPRGRELTAQEFLNLSDDEKKRYRSVVLRIPQSWGGTLLPFSASPYESIREKAIHTGETGALMAQYNRALFELEHPRVKVEFLNFDMWSDNFRSVLAVALSSNRAPAVYVARDLPQTIYQGMFADLTDLLRTWDQADRQPDGSVREGTVSGRTYTVAGNELGGTVIRYRKDWFREAGIFNERGEPGPPSDWTWADFRRIAKRLSDPAKKRWGYAGQAGPFFYDQAHGIQLYVPDRSGRSTWKFNDADPRLLEALAAVRAMVRDEQSAITSVSMGWSDWHAEFDAGRAAMIQSFSPHIPRESLEQPFKFGKDRPFRDTVGMALPPSGPTGLNGFRALTNLFGFDPTLSPEQLRAAFDWTKSFFYGDIFANTLRADLQRDRALGKRSIAYAILLTTPYQPEEGLLKEPLSAVFPADYLRLYRRIRAYPSPPLPREFGLQEPPANEWTSAVKALFSEAITRRRPDLRALVTQTAHLANRTILNSRTPGDRQKLRAYYAALGAFYERHFPRFYREEWPALYERYYRVD